MKYSNTNEFEGNNEDLLLVDEFSSKLEDLLKDRDYEYYYYFYIATYKYLNSVILLSGFSRDDIENGVNKILEPCLLKNDLVNSKINIDTNKLKDNYSKILDCIDVITKTLDKVEYNIVIAVLVSFETYIVDTGFIDRNSLKVLNDFADKY